VFDHDGQSNIESVKKLISFVFGRSQSALRSVIKRAQICLIVHTIARQPSCNFVWSARIQYLRSTGILT
jgi:hypothetical protein